MAQYHTVMIFVTLWHSINCLDISKNTICHDLSHIMAQYQIVVIYLTKYGTIPYCHDL